MAIQLDRRWVPSAESVAVVLPLNLTELNSRVFITNDGIFGDHSHPGTYSWDFAVNGASVNSITSTSTSVRHTGYIEELGNAILTQHDSPGEFFIASYGHLADGSTLVSEPDSLSAGKIATTGNTGSSTGAHLHLQVTPLFDSYADWSENFNSTRSSAANSLFAPISFDTALGAIFGGVAW